MTIYTTPLQLGYFFSLLMAVVFWVRSYREQRLSDFFLGNLFLCLALELQDYTFGFSGINFLWEELNGFPRNISLLIGPTFYFYLQSQTNRGFKLVKKHLLHLIPFVIYFGIEMSFFVQGKYAVQEWQQSQLAQVLTYVNWAAMLGSYTLYFTWSLKLYRNYRAWTENEFSNTELISFSWFRNFIWILIACVGSKELFHLLDALLQLDFNEDWWWNLVLVATSFYIGLTAYSQRQPPLLHYEASANEKLSVEEPISAPAPSTETEHQSASNENQKLFERLSKIMAEERLYLQPDLSLTQLAQHLKVNNNQLSACINQSHKQNFNDYINALRIAAFEQKIAANDEQRFTILALAFDCGFNSKTTFNRAFKKVKGMTPRAYIETQNG